MAWLTIFRPTVAHRHR